MVQVFRGYFLELIVYYEDFRVPAYHEWTAMMMVCIKLLLLIEQTLPFYGKHDVHNIPTHFKLDLIKFFSK